MYAVSPGSPSREEHVIGLQRDALQLRSRAGEIAGSFRFAKMLSRERNASSRPSWTRCSRAARKAGCAAASSADMTLLEPKHHQIARGSHGVRAGRPQQRVLAEGLALGSTASVTGFGSGPFLDEPGAAA